jgi:hypothetical protein
MKNYSSSQRDTVLYYLHRRTVSAVQSVLPLRAILHNPALERGKTRATSKALFMIQGYNK